MLYDGTLYVGGLAGYTSGALYNCYTSSLTKAQKLSVAASEFGHHRHRPPDRRV